MTETLKPQVGVGAVVFHRKKILLVKRKNPPAQNVWAIPGGKVKSGERLEDAVIRELLEETGIRIRPIKFIYVFDVIEKNHQDELTFHYVIIDFLAEPLSFNVRAADDALAAEWFSPEELKTEEVHPRTLELLKEKFNFI